MPDSISTFGKGTFYGCTSLQSMSLPASLTAIPEYAFSGCTALETIEIPGNVKTIGERAFYGCTTLEEVEIPASVTSIGAHAFYGCAGLTTASVPGTLTSIGDYAFGYCSNLTDVTFAENLTILGSYMFYGCTSLQSIRLPSSLTVIPAYAFSGCTSLKEVYMPDGLTTIRYCAFNKCTALKALYIPASVTIIEANRSPFYECGNVVLYCGAKQSGWSSGWSEGIKAVYYGYSRDEYNFAVSLTGEESEISIPEGTTVIAENAFKDNKNLKSVTIPESVVDIRSGAFSGCSKLSTVYFLGTEEQWNGLTIADGNDMLKSATVNYNSTQEFTVTFMGNGGHDVPAAQTKECGEFIALTESIPVREGYTFTGWSRSDTATAAEYQPGYVYEEDADLIIYAVWKINSYTITFKNYDGSVLQSGLLNYGSVPAYKGETPEKPETVGYSYAFSGWEPTINKVTGDAEYVAQFTETVKQYTISFVNEDGTVLQTGKWDYGTTPVYSGATPEKAATAQYTYTFKDWDKEIAAVTEDVTYTATFSSTVNKYTVKFVNHDGTELQSGELEYGSTPVYSGETPVKAATAQYTYTFNGWDKDIATVTEDAIYTATFSSTVNKYTVKFVNHDGTVLQSSELEYGSTPVYSGETPAKTATAQYTYNFNGWSPEITAVSNDVTYNAQFDSVMIYQCGDINLDGKITVEDVYMLRKAAAGLFELTDGQKAVADIYTDGRYNSLDVNLLRRFVAGLVTQIPYNAQ